MFELLFKYPLSVWQNGEFALAAPWPMYWLWLALAGAAIWVTFSLWWRTPPATVAQIESTGTASTGGRAALAPRWARSVPWLVLAALQWSMLATVSVLVWQPSLWVSKLAPGRNEVAVLIDDSRSMSLPAIHSSIDATALPNATLDSAGSRLKSVQRALPRVLEALAVDNRVTLYRLGSPASGGITPVATLGEVSADQPRSPLLQSVNQLRQRQQSTPLAAIVVVSDGADSGHLRNVWDALASPGAPVHSVGVGPLVMTGDVELTDVQLPARAAADGLVDAQLTFTGNGRPVTLEARAGNALLAAKAQDASPDGGSVSVVLSVPIAGVGLHDVTFTARAEQDAMPANNEQKRLIEAHKDVRQVLYLEGEPRWEYRFIRRALEDDASLRLVSWLRTSPRKVYRQGVREESEVEGGLPSAADELFSYDALIIGSVPAAEFSREQHALLRRFVDQRGGGILLLAGRQALADGGWNTVPLADALPVLLSNELGATYGTANVRAQPTPLGTEDGALRLDGDYQHNLAEWSSLPALADLQKVAGLKPGALVLLDALGESGSEPLLVWQRYGRGRAAVLLAASTWRWQMRLPAADERHTRFWRQLLSQLAQDAEAPISARAAVDAASDRLRLEVDVRDAEFAPSSDAQVVADVDSGEQSQTIVLTADADHPGRYTAALAVNANIYRVDFRVSRAGQPLASMTRHVRAAGAEREFFSAAQNRTLLTRLADSTGGQYWPVDQLDGLPAAIGLSAAGIRERARLALWDAPAFWLLLILLKGSEWLWRRRLGRV